MKISSDGEVHLVATHKTENYLCFVGERHGKKFKLYLNSYDLTIIGSNITRNGHTHKDLSAIIDVTDDTIPHQTSIDRVRNFQTQQLELLEKIVQNTTPVKRATKRTKV